MSEIDNLQQAEGKEEIIQNEDQKETLQNQEDASEENVQEDDHAINEIEAENAEDAEDKENERRHVIEHKDYESMSMDALVIELDKLVKNEQPQAIKKHVDGIKNEFKSKYNSLLEEKKEDFLSKGGNEIDFYYSSPLQKRFKEIYRNYRGKLNDYYKNLEKTLKSNLAVRLEIIEEIKSLINVEENINTTYKHFKELQERWRNTGPIPRDKYNNAWNSYHHHVEIFYDFLHLNRDLRDLDFKHNLDQKLKIIERAEDLAKNDNALHAFRELQVLHKMWKEELGPVPKEHREEIWQRFKAATKIIHDKRQTYYSELDKIYEKNLESKQDIIAKIEAITSEGSNSHSGWQKKIREVEALREEFFKAGKVPIKVNEATWAKFKDAVRTFNRSKNAFYKDLKKSQYENLQKKLELIKIAEDNKDSDDFETTTPLMKKIQSEWKQIGHVPRRDSDRIWNQFKSACNFYFDKLHSKRNAANKEGMDAYNSKHKLLDELRSFKAVKDKDENLSSIKEYISKWSTLGRVPSNKRYIEGKFYKTLDHIFKSLGIDKSEAELIKFENKLNTLSDSDDKSLIDDECNFIKKRIDDTKSEITQLENNLQFFSNASEESPVVKEVQNKISAYKKSLEVWETKLNKVKSLY